MLLIIVKQVENVKIHQVASSLLLIPRHTHTHTLIRCKRNTVHENMTVMGISFIRTRPKLQQLKLDDDTGYSHRNYVVA